MSISVHFNLFNQENVHKNNMNIIYLYSRAKNRIPKLVQWYVPSGKPNAQINSAFKSCVVVFISNMLIRLYLSNVSQCKFHCSSKWWWFWAQIEVIDMQTHLTHMHTITSADPALGLFRVRIRGCSYSCFGILMLLFIKAEIIRVQGHEWPKYICFSAVTAVWRQMKRSRRSRAEWDEQAFIGVWIILCHDNTVHNSFLLAGNSIKTFALYTPFIPYIHITLL